jgi:hypothetical protein
MEVQSKGNDKGPTQSCPRKQALLLLVRIASAPVVMRYVCACLELVRALDNQGEPRQLRGQIIRKPPPAPVLILAYPALTPALTYFYRHSSLHLPPQCSSGTHTRTEQYNSSVPEAHR